MDGVDPESMNFFEALIRIQAEAERAIDNRGLVENLPYNELTQVEKAMYGAGLDQPDLIDYLNGTNITIGSLCLTAQHIDTLISLKQDLNAHNTYGSWITLSYVVLV